MLFRRSLMHELATNMAGTFLILFGIMLAQRTAFTADAINRRNLPRGVDDADTLVP